MSGFILLKLINSIYTEQYIINTLNTGGYIKLGNGTDLDNYNPEELKHRSVYGWHNSIKKSMEGYYRGKSMIGYYCCVSLCDTPPYIGNIYEDYDFCEIYEKEVE